MSARSYIDPEALSCITTYAGHEDPEDWLGQVQALADVYQWQDADCVRIATLKLRDAAQRWARQHTFSSWHDFCQQLLQRFGDTLEVAVTHLDHCYQQPDEQPREFADRFLQLAATAGRCEDPALVHSFTQRLLPELSLGARRQRLHSIAETVAYCEYWLGSNQVDNNCFMQEVDLDLCTFAEKSHPCSAYDMLSMLLLSETDTQFAHHMLQHILSAQEQIHANDQEILLLRSQLLTPHLQRQPNMTGTAQLCPLSAADAERHTH